MVSKSQYGEREVNASKSVLLELVHLLRELCAMISSRTLDTDEIMSETLNFL
jgi:hypothetical protein